MNIDNLFKRQMERENIDKTLKKNNIVSNNFDFSEIISQIPNDDEYQQKLSEKIKEMGGSLIHSSDIKIGHIQGEKKISNIDVSDLITSEEEVHTIIEHAFCPNCGEELKTEEMPVYQNASAFGYIYQIECRCGYKKNINSKLPRIKYINNKNEQIL